MRRRYSSFTGRDGVITASALRQWQKLAEHAGKTGRGETTDIDELKRLRSAAEGLSVEGHDGPGNVFHRLREAVDDFLKINPPSWARDEMQRLAGEVGGRCVVCLALCAAGQG